MRRAAESYRVINGQNINAEEKSSFTFEDAMAFVESDLVLA